MSDRTSASPPRLGLSFESTGPAVTPRDAATVILLRESADGLEVFCVERSKGSRFLGGAVVFPGGKVDDADAEAPSLPSPRGTHDELVDTRRERAIAVAACRELLEEAGVVATRAEPEKAALVVAALAQGMPMGDALAHAAVQLDLTLLHPFARWITPEAEPRRFDARFFLLAMPAGQEAKHDGHETTTSFWATPREVLERFARGDIQLAPPTTRCLELLADVASIEAAFGLAKRQSPEPICPCFVPGDPPMLALPGDPEHELASRRVAGPTRFVLREGRFVSEDPPLGADRAPATDQ
jgi:8-oxo-dGTP pyrophosphatase MutT (NUDIX family)